MALQPAQALPVQRWGGSAALGPVRDVGRWGEMGNRLALKASPERRRVLLVTKRAHGRQQELRGNEAGELGASDRRAAQPAGPAPLRSRDGELCCERSAG